MRWFYFPFVLTIGGNILYHVSQKSIPRGASPLVTMMTAYAVAILVCALGLLFSPAEKSFLSSVRESNWSVFLIGIGIASVEIGYLMGYRLGWKVSAAPVLSNVAAALLLVIVGVAAFREQLSTRNFIGILLCIVGLALVTRK
jgi:uncharacterized membrane protein